MTGEWEQYRIDQAAAWLSRVRRVAGYADYMESSADRQLELADNLRGIDYSAVRVSTSPTADAIPDAVARHMELAEDFAAIASAARELQSAAAHALSRLPDPTEAECLQRYYVDRAKTWEHVCVAMGYTYDGLMKLRRRALLHAYDAMPHSERDPIHPAL